MGKDSRDLSVNVPCNASLLQWSKHRHHEYMIY